MSPESMSLVRSLASWPPPNQQALSTCSSLSTGPPQPHTRPGWGRANLICLPKSVPRLHNFDAASPKRLPSATALPPPIRQIVRNNSSTSDYPRYTTERHPSLECHRFHTSPLLHCNEMFLCLFRFLYSPRSYAPLSSWLRGTKVSLPTSVPWGQNDDIPDCTFAGPVPVAAHQLNPSQTLAMCLPSCPPRDESQGPERWVAWDLTVFKLPPGGCSSQDITTPISR
jgi:hypothetical protein